MNKLAVVLFFGFSSCVVCQMAGAPAEATTAEDLLLIKRMAEFAVGEIGSEYNLQRVISGTKQVVNGMLFNIKLEAVKQIAGKNASKKRHCNVLVYEIKHQSYLELEEFHCHFINKQPQL